MKRLLFTLFLAGSFSLTMAQSGYGVGDVVENFTLLNVNEESVSLSDYAEQSGVIVVFTCNTCPYAVAYEERIKKLATDYNDAGWPVVAIQPNDDGRSPGDSFDNMVTRSQEQEYAFPYLYDENQEVARIFGASRTPHTYLLQVVEGEFVVKYIGAIDDNPSDPDGVEVNYVDEAINALNAGESVERESTKAIGCTIKWAS